PAGQGDLDQPHRLDLRLDARPEVPRHLRRDPGGRGLRRDAGAGLRGDRRGRPHDQGPCAADRADPALDDNARVPGQARPEPAEGDGMNRETSRAILGSGVRATKRPGLLLALIIGGLMAMAADRAEAAEPENTLVM